MSKASSPTKRRKKLRQDCEHKVSYTSAFEAVLAIEEVRHAGKLKDPDNARPYVCPICGLYHWGNNTRGDFDRVFAATDKAEGRP